MTKHTKLLKLNSELAQIQLCMYLTEVQAVLILGPGDINGLTTGTSVPHGRWTSTDGLLPKSSWAQGERVPAFSDQSGEAHVRSHGRINVYGENMCPYYNTLFCYYADTNSLPRNIQVWVCSCQKLPAGAQLQDKEIFVSWSISPNPFYLKYVYFCKLFRN